MEQIRDDDVVIAEVRRRGLKFPPLPSTQPSSGRGVLSLLIDGADLFCRYSGFPAAIDNGYTWDRCDSPWDAHTLFAYHLALEDEVLSCPPRVDKRAA